MNQPRLVGIMMLSFGAAMTVPGRTAPADQFRTIQGGGWAAASTWEQRQNDDCAWRPASRAPGCGDSAHVRHHVGVGGEAGVAILIVDQQVLLRISDDARLTFCGESLKATVNGRIELSGPDSALRITGDTVFSGGANGHVHGPHDNSTIEIEPGSCSATLTNSIRFHGCMDICKGGIGSGEAIFFNDGTVSADQIGALVLSSTLDSIGDSKHAKWVIEMESSAVLKFERGSTALSGDFEMLTDGGASAPFGGLLLVFSNVATAGHLTYDVGTITPLGGASFCSGSRSGACGTQPTGCISSQFDPCP